MQAAKRLDPRPAPISAVVSSAKTPFVIELRLRGKALSAAQQATLKAAADRVAALIVSRFQPVKLDLPANSCDKGLPALREQLDHFVVFVTVKDLGDEIYGDSSPCELHDKTYLPIYGTVDLNSRGLDDLAQPELLDTMIHELLHALGVGTLWTADERVSLSGDSDDKTLVRKVGKQWYYTGARALAAYRALGGSAQGILLDPDQGHWSGNVVCSEILSGSAGDVTDRVNPVSPLTLGALEDLGYSVNTKLADRYALPKGRCPLD
ncbi:hypothetical protein DKM44_01250 [Deinococcus irradiatisoli]|uniref:Peptidase n=1 Tax=Deinococcus irradiatisoli TaxID=2202254 RepID=A0A2Z3JF54_9DEIO|nr:hypothetical protein DKM44_01250 [Deinococcus irradiatisoli]